MQARQFPIDPRPYDSYLIPEPSPVRRARERIQWAEERLSKAKSRFETQLAHETVLGFAEIEQGKFVSLDDLKRELGQS